MNTKKKLVTILSCLLLLVTSLTSVFADSSTGDNGGNISGTGAIYSDWIMPKQPTTIVEAYALILYKPDATTGYTYDMFTNSGAMLSDRDWFDKIYNLTTNRSASIIVHNDHFSSGTNNYEKTYSGCACSGWTGGGSLGTVKRGQGNTCRHGGEGGGRRRTRRAGRGSGRRERSC